MQQVEILPQDLLAAAEQGIISEEQVARLQALATRRSGLQNTLSAEDEPFELFRGMNEIFISVAIILTVSGLLMLLPFSAVLAVWGLGEYFIQHKRMLLPAVVLSGAFAICCEVAFIAIGEHYNMHDYSLISLLASACCAFFYWRFRVPFSLLPLAVLALIAVGGLVAFIIPDAGALYRADMWAAMFDVSYSPVIATTTLVFGLVVFVAAMHFDLKDPHRISRYSACGFWLHMAAAPAIVNMIAYSIYNVHSDYVLAALVPFLFLISIVALVIDRRSFLLSGCTYLGLTIYNLATLTNDDGLSVPVIFLIVGGMMLLVGTRWAALRRWLMRGLPNFSLKDKLPPYEAVA